MAIDRRVGTKVEKSFKKEESAGIRVDPYPYVGIVKNNLDPTRTGRLQVWIPDLGGDPTQPQNWRTVSYASPYMGTTNQKSTTQNSFENTSHTYGMWMVPPDIGVEVIVIFIAGDVQRGYWIACVNSSISRYMLPGMASSTHVDTQFASGDVKKSITKGYQYPVTEFNTNETEADLKNFVRLPKPIHEEQFKVLVKQGLDRDNTRGTVTSSSQRESPSNVFGISTPGRQYGNDPADDPNYAKKVASGTIKQDDYAVTARKGGHTFIMDDGKAGSGVDQLIRLRTSRGRQIMMHDSDNILYVANADGTVWIEMTEKGALNVFSASGINFRTQGSMNFHADSNIVMNAGGKFNVHAEGKIQIETPSKFTVIGASAFNIQSDGKIESKAGAGINLDAGGTISLKAGPKIILNAGVIDQRSSPGKEVKTIDPLTMNSLPDTVLDSGTGLYKVTPGLINSIVSVAPGHEPFYLRVLSPPPPEPDAPKIKPKEKFAGANDKTKATAGTMISAPVTEQDIRNQPAASAPIGTLSKDQTTALLSQIATSNAKKVADAADVAATTGTANTTATTDTTTSEDPYALKDESLGSVGKYQFTHEDLIELGYVKSSVTSNDQLSNPNSWTGKDGIESLDGYYASPSIQESMMVEKSTTNYNALLVNGAITSEDSPETVGGVLAVAHELGPDAAIKWRETGEGVGADEAFQSGKFAVSQLAPKVAEIHAG